MFRQLPAAVADVALLVARILVGVIMVAYGWRKMVDPGLEATAAGFAKGGVPFPPLSAAFAGIVELVGGGLLILGAATALVCALMVVDMVGAIVTTGQYHAVIAPSGFALSGAVLAGALLLATSGAGRFSIDYVLLGGRRHARRPSAF
jgi:putative oxidoreductase